MKYDMEKAIRYHKEVGSIGGLLGLFFAVPLYIVTFTCIGVILYGLGNLRSPAETLREFDIWFNGLGNAPWFFLLCSGAIPFIAFSIMSIYFRIQAWRYGYKKWMKAFE